MKNKREFLKIKITNDDRNVRGVLHVVEFQDGEHYVIYVPSLQLSAYGDNRQEAQQMLEEVLDDFCEGLTALPERQLLEALQSFGWERNKFFKKQFENSKTFIDKEGILNNFNLAPDTQIKEEYLTV